MTVSACTVRSDGETWELGEGGIRGSPSIMGQSDLLEESPKNGGSLCYQEDLLVSDTPSQHGEEEPEE